jgi:PiT family inorganic phosphate transporter
LIELVLLMLAASFFITWVIGANDASIIGTAIGGRIFSYRRAITLLVAFAFLGAILEGYKVMGPVGTGIIKGGAFSESPEVVAVAMICAGLLATVTTRLGLPISVHQAVIGALVGAGIAIGTFTSVAIAVDWEYIFMMAVAWVLTPFGAMVFAFILYKILDVPLRRVKTPAKLNMLFALLVVISSCYIAYAMGANDVGTTMSAMYATGVGGVSAQHLVLFGGFAFGIGALVYSRKVIETVGIGITSLGPMTAFVAQIGAALIVHLFTQWGFPVSATQAIIGGVVGAGLVKGMVTVSGRRISRILLAWVLIPVTAIIFSFCAAWLVLTV